MQPLTVVIEDWDGDGGIRIPDEALQELGIDVGDTLYLIETVVGTGVGFVLSKTPTLPDRLDELLAQLEPGSTNR
jgi:bifunctional DNA-binding transcriptional regulator/antitoxin component of YhaV-PrlF toxin-antitoxin module